MNTKPVRIGIMSFAHMHATAYAHGIQINPNAQLIGIADHDKNRARLMALHYDTKPFESYAALLSSDVDAVVICSENVRHRKLVEMAASAGKHILCEKPLATSVEDGQAMIDVCRANNVQLMTAFPCRYSPVFQRMKSVIDSGDAGEVLAIRGTNRGRNPGGWFINKAESGGGATMDHTVHVTDLCRWLLKDEVKTVYAEISNNISHAAFDDVGFLTLTFERGTFATLDASWSRPKSYPTWGDVTMEVITDKGTLGMDMFSQNLTLYNDKSGGVEWQHWGDSIDDGLIEGFVNAIATGEPVPITGEDGLRAAEVALAAYRSAELHAPVAVRA